MSGGGDSQQPVAGRTKSKEQQEEEARTSGTSSSTTSGTTTGSLTGTTATSGTETGATTGTMAGQTTGATTGATTGMLEQTLPDWLRAALQGNIEGYGGTVGAFGNAIQDWQAAGFSPDQLTGFQSQRDAFAPGGAYGTALDELTRTAQGDYLYGGAGFNAAVEAAQRQAMPEVLSRFGLAGRDGGLAATALGQAFADPFARQYGDERSRQLAAAGQLPALGLLPGQTYQDIGKQYQQLQQYGQNYPLETLYPQLAQLQQGFTGFASPFLGQQTAGTTAGTSLGTTAGQTAGTSLGTTTGLTNVNQQTRGTTDMTTQAMYDQLAESERRGLTKGTEVPSYFPGSQTAGIFGGALAGAGMGAQIGGPWGALAGGVGGGLLGAFG